MGETAVLTELEHQVLAAVDSLARNAYGVTIGLEVRRTTGRLCHSPHRTLGRLESGGLIASRHGPARAVRGGRAKRLYRITPSGSAALARSRARLG